LEWAQEIIVAQNNELKKENDQLRLQLAQAQSEGGHPEPKSNHNTVPVVERKREEPWITQQATNPQQIHKRQISPQQASSERTDSTKEERQSSPNEHNRKRRHRAVSDQEGVQSRSKAVEFLDRFHASLGTTCVTMSFICAWDKLFEDLSSAHEPSSDKRKRRVHLEDFVSFAEPRHWFCFRDVCESGKQAVGFTFARGCPSHGPGCDIIIKTGDNKFGYDILATTFQEMQRRG
jgi:hypothetical protein